MLVSYLSRFRLSASSSAGKHEVFKCFSALSLSSSLPLSIVISPSLSLLLSFSPPPLHPSLSLWSVSSYYDGFVINIIKPSCLNRMKICFFFQNPRGGSTVPSAAPARLWGAGTASQGVPARRPTIKIMPRPLLSVYCNVFTVHNQCTSTTERKRMKR